MDCRRALASWVLLVLAIGLPIAGAPARAQMLAEHHAAINSGQGDAGTTQDAGLGASGALDCGDETPNLPPRRAGRVAYGEPPCGQHAELPSNSLAPLTPTGRFALASAGLGLYTPLECLIDNDDFGNLPGCEVNGLPPFDRLHPVTFPLFQLRLSLFVPALPPRVFVPPVPPVPQVFITPPHTVLILPAVHIPGLFVPMRPPGVTGVSVLVPHLPGLAVINLPPGPTVARLAIAGVLQPLAPLPLPLPAAPHASTPPLPSLNGAVLVINGQAYSVQVPRTASPQQTPLSIILTPIGRSATVPPAPLAGPAQIAIAPASAVPPLPPALAIPGTLTIPPGANPATPAIVLPAVLALSPPAHPGVPLPQAANPGPSEIANAVPATASPSLPIPTLPGTVPIPAAGNPAVTPGVPLAGQPVPPTPNVPVPTIANPGPAQLAAAIAEAVSPSQSIPKWTNPLTTPVASSPAVTPVAPPPVLPPRVGPVPQPSTLQLGLPNVEAPEATAAIAVVTATNPAAPITIHQDPQLAATVPVVTAPAAPDLLPPAVAAFALPATGAIITTPSVTPPDRVSPVAAPSVSVAAVPAAAPFAGVATMASLPVPTVAGSQPAPPNASATSPGVTAPQAVSPTTVALPDPHTPSGSPETAVANVVLLPPSADRGALAVALPGLAPSLPPAATGPAMALVAIQTSPSLPKPLSAARPGGAKLGGNVLVIDGKIYLMTIQSNVSTGLPIAAATLQLTAVSNQSVNAVRPAVLGPKGSQPAIEILTVSPPTIVGPIVQTHSIAVAAVYSGVINSGPAVMSPVVGVPGALQPPGISVPIANWPPVATVLTVSNVAVTASNVNGMNTIVTASIIVRGNR